MFMKTVSNVSVTEVINCVQIGQHHVVDASSEEEVCTLARYVVSHQLNVVMNCIAAS